MTGSAEVVRMDEGSANVVRGLVEKEVSCGNSMVLKTEDGPFDFLRQALFCREMFATAEPDDPQSKTQCVAMGGELKRCPFIRRGNPSEIKKKLVALQELTAKNLVHSQMGNFNSWQPQEDK